MFKKMKNNKKGFTLVELIVVLVILAILAAFLVPALTGYINKAKEKTAIAETRQVVMATQTILDEKTGELGINTYQAWDATLKTDIYTLAELPTTDPKQDITAATVTKGVLETMTYKTTKGVVVTYTKANPNPYVVTTSN